MMMRLLDATAERDGMCEWSLCACGYARIRVTQLYVVGVVRGCTGGDCRVRVAMAGFARLSACTCNEQSQIGPACSRDHVSQTCSAAAPCDALTAATCEYTTAASVPELYDLQTYSVQHHSGRV